MSKLFSPFKLREITIPNRIGVSPMCQYSAHDGLVNDWHLVHLGSRAVGGAGLVVFEATAISPEGRITPFDTGLWNDAQAHKLGAIVGFVKSHGSVPAIQLAHAGRKASSQRPWEGGMGLSVDQGGWEPVAPSALRFDQHRPTPKALDTLELDRIQQNFVASALRADWAGFEILELHAAHGYLLHSFLSPLSNIREDEYGGSVINRMRFPLRVVRAVRAVWPQSKPLFVRLSISDWVDGGWNLEQSLEFCRNLKEIGVDLVDCSSGGLLPDAKIESGPGYQVSFAQSVRDSVGIATAAVGEITTATQAETIVRTEQADMVLLARELLRDPYWPQRARIELDGEAQVPRPYRRAHRR